MSSQRPIAETISLHPVCAHATRPGTYYHEKESATRSLFLATLTVPSTTSSCRSFLLVSRQHLELCCQLGYSLYTAYMLKQLHLYYIYTIYVYILHVHVCAYVPYCDACLHLQVRRTRRTRRRQHLLFSKS